MTFDLENGDTGGVSVLERVLRISGEERRFLWGGGATAEEEEGESLADLVDGSVVGASLVVTPEINAFLAGFPMVKQNRG